LAFDQRVGRREIEGGEQLPRRARLVEGLDGLVGETHELEAAPARPARDRRDRPRGVAEQPVLRSEAALAAQQQVDDQPVGLEPEVFDRNVHRAAHRAVRAIAADQPVGLELGDLACGVARAHAHTASAGLELEHLDAAAQRSAVERAQAPFEHALEVGLVEHVRAGPAGQARDALAAEGEQRLTGGVAPLGRAGGVAQRAHFVRHAGRLEDAADLVVEVDRAGERIGPRPALQHRCPPAAPGEQDREHEPDGPRPDDRDFAALPHAFASSPLPRI